MSALANHAGTCTDIVVILSALANHAGTCTDIVVILSALANDAGTCTDIVVILSALANDAGTCTYIVVILSALANDAGTCTDIVVILSALANDAGTCTDIVVILSALANDAGTCTDKNKLSNILRLSNHILKLDSHSQTMISVVLGYRSRCDNDLCCPWFYTSHLVAMITKFLDVPLRYPVLNKDIAQVGSISTVLSTYGIKTLPR